MVAATKDDQKAKGLKWSRLGIPDAKGRPRPGGALTAEMLSLLRENHDNPNPEEKLTWVSALSRCRATLREKALARRREALSAQENDQQVQVQVQVQVPQEPQEPQEPQLSSSRMIDVNEPLHIIPPRSNGKRRAVIIGINYVGQKDKQLTTCHADAMAMKQYLEEYEGFKEADMTILMDDGNHTMPTKKNILKAFRRITRLSKPGDSAVIHYSGHGGSIKDQNGDEADGKDETLIPVDADKLGDVWFWGAERAPHIVDDDILAMLVMRLKADVSLTCFMDCCFSGTVLDLPYRYKADGIAMERDHYPLKRLVKGLLCAACGFSCIASVVGLYFFCDELGC
mmetsp:Transcript_26048/g.60482  ORF Transcript_26048/g.60482 Transcript_26048/m.60482 type:complete len:341 (-) Transcript_26048:284-1306(-)